MTVTNPLSSQHAVLRQSLVGGLLEVVSGNVRQGREDVAIFEVGKGYGAPGDPPTHEWWRLGFALTGAAEPPAWNRPARPYDLDDAKGVVELLCRSFGFVAPTYEPITDDPNLHPGRAARVTAGGDVVGRLGELNPETVAALDLRVERVYVAELAVAGLAGGRPSVPRVTTPSRHPSVERDLAVIVTADRPAADVQGAIVRHGGKLLRGVTLFDVYRGRPLEAGEVSLAYRMTFRDDDRTLTEGEVDEAVAAVVHGLTSELGARFRT
jgi:phenylalanyl-tRNA synthetase beta chain